MPACLGVRTEARYGAMGYDHRVILASACAKKLDCTVKTDVSPDAVQVSIKPNEIVEVVTWRGSPASVFKAFVNCTEALDKR